MGNVMKLYITKTPGVCGGKACIAGHRIRVMGHRRLARDLARHVPKSSSITFPASRWPKSTPPWWMTSTPVRRSKPTSGTSRK